VGKVDTVKNKKEFKSAVFKPVQINDSRFGIRKIYLNTLEKPSILTYNNPGRHWWGTR
jgi:hypothetical protein